MGFLLSNNVTLRYAMPEEFQIKMCGRYHPFPFAWDLTTFFSCRVLTRFWFRICTILANLRFSLSTILSFLFLIDSYCFLSLHHSFILYRASLW
jgi:hypothetical protein